MSFFVTCVAALWWIAAIVTFAASCIGALVQPRLQARRENGEPTTPVSLVLPVKLVNPGFETAQASAFRQDHPNYEILVGAMEAQSPALVRMRALMAASARPSRLVAARPIGSMSPKLDTLAAPIEAAAHDVIVTKDSNITLAPDGLRALLRGLGAGVGLVCAVPVAVRASGLAGRIEAVLINRDARLLLTASASGKGYGVGKVMAFRRSDLVEAGGIAAIGYTVAEDTALSEALARRGLRTVFSARTVAQEIGAPRLAAVFGRQARWAVIRRTEEPLTFVFEPVACPLPATAAAALAAPLLGLGAAPAAALTLAGWYAIECLVTAAKGWEIAPWGPLAFLGRDLVLLAAWARAWTTREIVWAGRRQQVRDEAPPRGRN